jgi:hypothetical protein
MKTELTLTQLAAIGAGASQFVEGKALIGNLTVHPTRSGYAGDQPFREAFARAVRDAVLNHIVESGKMKTHEICLRPDCGVGITHYEGSPPACTAKAADPYAELKKAHAEGKAIQYQQDGIWKDFRSCPVWSAWTVDQYRIKPETFEAHGKTWTRHTPGDAMPCDGEVMVQALLGDNTFATQPAEDWSWKHRDSKYDIIGWRYADEQPEPQTPSWTPAVGDVVQLKSGGPKMTVHFLDAKNAGCVTFANSGEFTFATLPQACLTFDADNK